VDPSLSTGRLAGLQDRSSRPHSLSTAYGEALARRGGARLHGFHIAQITGLSRAHRQPHSSPPGFEPHAQSLEPAVPLIRYEHAAPGDLLHLDIKQLGRFSDVIVRPDGRRRGQAAPADGSMFMSLSITIPASPSPRSCPTSRLLPRSPSCARRLLITPA
jgi:hypothetical protein